MVDGGRLYAPRFYEQALGPRPHTYGLGSVLRIPAAPGRAEIWAFKLEYSDAIAERHLQIYFDSLTAVLPSSIGDQLSFVARSAHQHDLVEQLRTKRRPLSARLLDYEELVVPGTIEIYNPGLAAGYLRLVEPKEVDGLTGARDEILVLPYIPDELPQAAGVISAVPQTPLSHINLLAQNRGIPNVHLGGVNDNLQLRQFARDRMPVVLSTENGRFIIRALDKKIYETWLDLSGPPARVLPHTSQALADYTQDLRREDSTRVAQFRQEIGGKAAGYVTLLAGRARVPQPALALTTRAFHEHMQRLYPEIFPALADSVFLASPQIRMLALEGEKKFKKRLGEKEATLFLQKFHHDHPRGPVADLVARGGLQAAVRQLPMEPNVLAHIMGRIRARFSSLAAAQGLRFRSSSTVEDIEGFNGAGLYASSTGFLDPSAAARPKDRKRSVEFAIKRTWASFFSFAAYEERINEGIDPLSGGDGNFGASKVRR